MAGGCGVVGVPLVWVCSARGVKTNVRRIRGNVEGLEKVGAVFGGSGACSEAM